MNPPGSEIVDDPAVLAAHFADAPAIHAYALADLEEPFWSASTWYRRDDGVVGIVSLPDGEGEAVYAVSTRDPAASLALLVDLLPRLRPGQLVTGPVGLANAVGAQRPLAWAGPHERYRLGSFRPVDTEAAEPLGLDDLPALTSLYETEPGAAFFLPHMLADNAFMGVRREGGLVAAAGTHVLSERHGVAAIGAVYTHPAHRGIGLGRITTAATVERIRGRVATVALNVASTNATARRIYEGLGFEPVLTYEECELAG